jgi:hypothetical protein
VQQNPKSISIKESNNRLSMTINKVETIKKAIEVLQKISA